MFKLNIYDKSRFLNSDIQLLLVVKKAKGHVLKLTNPYNAILIEIKNCTSVVGKINVFFLLHLSAARRARNLIPHLDL